MLDLLTLWVALTEGMCLVARFLVSEGFCFLAEVSATAGELKACRHILGGCAWDPALSLCSCRAEARSQEVSSEC